MDENIKIEYLEFLDALRETGLTNMFAATPYLIGFFPELSREQAKAVLLSWIKTFGSRHNK